VLKYCYIDVDLVGIISLQPHKIYIVVMIRKFKQQHLVTRQVVKSENVHILTDKIIALGSFFPPSDRAAIST
jgi:hypothetical protein